MFHMMAKVAAGERPAFALDSVLQANDTTYPANTIQMYFTSNHDENSWNKADYGIFPGAVHAPFAVFSQTMKLSVPLIYSGQEEPILRAIPFFEKDSLSFKNLKRAKFYKTLLALRKRSVALSADASFRKVKVGNDQALYAYVREKNHQKVLVVLNLSSGEQPVTISEKALWGNPNNVFAGSKEKLDGTKWMIEPWGYAVYEYSSK
jgi:hypothetical protein